MQPRARLPRSLQLLVALALGGLACQPPAPTCPEVPESERFLRGAELKQVLMATPVPYATPAMVRIGGSQVMVDKVVSGPLCNDNWRGIVYVGCDVRVAEWHDTPTFLRGCQLHVEPGTVVYVAAHNNTAYYEGCSCHTDEAAAP